MLPQNSPLELLDDSLRRGHHFLERGRERQLKVQGHGQQPSNVHVRQASYIREAQIPFSSPCHPGHVIQVGSILLLKGGGGGGEGGGGGGGGGRGGEG